MPLKIDDRRGRSLLLATVTLSAFAVLAVPALQPGVLRAQDSATQSLVEPDGSYAEIVRRTKGAIVTVTTRAPAAVAAGPQGQVPYEEFFRRFFGDQAPVPGVPGIPGGPAVPGAPQGPAPEAMGLGSGFVVASDGVIVTNNHVVAGASTVSVTLDDGRELAATVVGTDPRTDIAVLKVEAEDLPTVAWGDSDAVDVGDQVIAIGNPFGVGTTVTAGIVSARGRDLHNGPYDDFLQVDAAINHGNSGGALIATDGTVIGITSAIYSPNNGNVGVGFAIPAAMAQNIVERLVETGAVERGYLGVRIQPVDPDVAEALGLDAAQGALVSEVTEGTPAAAAGLKSGDVVLALNGEEVADARALTRRVADLAPGSDAVLTLWRDGAETEATVRLGALPGEEQVAGATPAAPQAAPELPELGLNLSVLTPEDRAALGLAPDATGVVVRAVDPASAAAAEGIMPGDLIVSANTTPVSDPADVESALQAAEADGRDAMLLLVARQGAQFFVALPIQAS